MALSGLIASGINIAGYAGLLLGGRTILHSIANGSPGVDCFRNQYRRVLLGGRTILHGITNYSLSVDTSITGYAGLLLGERTILDVITNNSPRVDCFTNHYHRVRVPFCMA